MDVTFALFFLSVMGVFWLFYHVEELMSRLVEKHGDKSFTFVALVFLYFVAFASFGMLIGHFGIKLLIDISKLF